MKTRLGSLLLASLLTASCASLPSASKAAVGSISLNLTGLYPTERLVQVLPAGTQAKLTVSGPGLAQALTVTAAVDGQTMAATLTGIPAGPNRVIELETQDAAGSPIPGGRFRTTATVQEGANQAVIAPSTTPRGDVFAKLLADGSPLASNLDATRLQEAIEAIQRTQRVAHFALIDGGAIADALKANGGKLDSLSVSNPAFVQAPATRTVTVMGLPDNLMAEVWLDDPVSPKQTGLGNGSYRVEPIKPGVWNLYGRAGSLQVGPVAIDTTGSTPVLLDFSRSVETLEKLPTPRGGPAAGTLRVALPGGEAEAMVVAGGLDGTASDGVVAFDGTTWHALPPMPVAVSHAASVVHDGKLWVLGGLQANGMFSDAVQVFDGTAWTLEPPLPTVSILGTAAIANQQLVFTPGLRSLTAVDNTLQFTVYPEVFVRDLTGSPVWQVVAQLATPRLGAAYATLGGKHYVISGLTPSAGGPTPVLAMEVYDAATRTVTAGAPIPTPRFGAMSWVADGKVYVAGGVTPKGKPLNHLEAYDPVRDRWEVLPPLKTPRAHAAAALLNGKALLAGGHDGILYMGSLVALDSLEALKP
ncbi:N-acetylneuraminate epimerase [compost metagenome]